MKNREPSSPVQVKASALLLSLFGFYCAVFTPVLLMTGMFAGSHVLSIGIAHSAAALCSFTLAKQLQRGCAWAWWGAISFTILLLGFFSFWIIDELTHEANSHIEDVIFPIVTAMVLVSSLTMLLHHRTRAWCEPLQFKLRTFLGMICLLAAILGVIRAVAIRIGRADRPIRVERDATAVQDIGR